MHAAGIDVGIGVAEHDRPRDFTCLFDPAGHAIERYEKHFLSRPERRQHDAIGDACCLRDIDGSTYDLVICKDMHFASLGRACGQRGTGVMLVPARDFGYRDAWVETRTMLVRGRARLRGNVRVTNAC